MGLVDTGYQPWSGDLQSRPRRVAAMARIGIHLAFEGTITRLMLAFTYTIVIVYIGILYMAAESRMQPEMTIPDQPLARPSSASLSPTSAQRIDPPPSMTRTRPRPGSASASRTRELSSCTLTVAIAPKNFFLPP